MLRVVWTELCPRYCAIRSIPTPAATICTAAVWRRTWGVTSLSPAAATAEAKPRLIDRTRRPPHSTTWDEVAALRAARSARRRVAFMGTTALPFRGPDRIKAQVNLAAFEIHPVPGQIENRRDPPRRRQQQNDGQMDMRRAIGIQQARNLGLGQVPVPRRGLRRTLDRRRPGDHAHLLRPREADAQMPQFGVDRMRLAPDAPARGDIGAAIGGGDLICPEMPEGRQQRLAGLLHMRGDPAALPFITIRRPQIRDRRPARPAPHLPINHIARLGLRLAHRVGNQPKPPPPPRRIVPGDDKAAEEPADGVFRCHGKRDGEALCGEA
jgi:hypothetical protein